MNSRETATDLIFGRWRSQILHAGVRLGIFEAVGEAPRPAGEVAEELSLDPDLTYRLMRALGCIGTLEEDADGRFRLSGTGTFFRSDHPQTLRGMVLLEEGPEHYAIWKHLPEMIRTGTQDGFVREYGRPVFAHIQESPAYGALFNEAMTAYSAGESAMVLEALEDRGLDGIDHLCDVGGGHGHLLASFLERFPELRGTVYDLARTFADEDRLWPGRAGVADRCAYEAGDMFDRVPEADGYILKHILHDWNDDECVRILANIHTAAPPEARVFVAEYVVPGPETPHFSKLFDIHMMCGCTGRERTEREYGELFERAGWRHAATWYPESRLFGVVEAAKA